MFPSINTKPVKNVTMPELSGGINLRDSVSMIEDNQLTDGLNVWYKDAVLKTRPGMEVLGTPILNAIVEFTEIDRVSEIIPRATEIYRAVEGETYRLYTVLVKTRSEWENMVLFFFVSGDKVVRLTELKRSQEGRKIYNYFTIEHENDIFCFVAEEDEGLNSKFHIYVLEAWYRGVEYGEGGSWEEVDISEKAYAPLVAVNCEMEGLIFGFKDAVKNITPFEGYNMLSSRYRMQYNLDSANEKLEFGLIHNMGDPLDRILDSLIGERVIARTTDKWGRVCTHELTLKNKAVCHEETQYAVDGLKMKVYASYIQFDIGEGYDVLIKENFGGLKNCLEIEVPFVQNNEAMSKIFNMTQHTWFGGTSTGINGGTRLFLGGCEMEQHKNLVLWSDLNNPFYFPENNYFYVGNSSQAITGFGKQNDMLVLFKEKEIFYTHFIKGKDYTVNDVIDKNVGEVTTISASFPLVQIHGSIGCDCPNTIQLCRNRLVWANSYGKVYTLVSNDQYNERNIYEVSNMIERRFKTESPNKIKKAVSCDWEGMYILFIENRMYCMDYNSYGYQHISTYLKNEDSNLKIPWWYWELPQAMGIENGLTSRPFAISSNENNLIFSRFEESEQQLGAIRNSHLVTYVMRNKKGYDEVANIREDTYIGTENLPIYNMMQTKIFDFGVPHKNKAISLVNISFGNNGGEPIALKYITENGEYLQESIILTHSDTAEYSAGYVRNKPFRPSVGLVNRFGLKLECEGDMAMDAFSIDYKLVGTAR